MATGGYRSHEAIWLGGASAPSTVPIGGYRSFEAFFLGGASAPFVIPPVPTPGGGGGSFRTSGPLPDEARKVFDLFDLEKQRKLRRDDEELIILISL